MRRKWLAVASVCLWFASGTLAPAQDQNNPEALKKELADTVAQLKAAQDRKNELANENEKLKAQVASMQKDLDELKQASATWAEQTYFLRAMRAAWEAFISHDPNLRARWEIFLEASPQDLLLPGEWTLGLPVPESIRLKPTTSPSTEPTTLPTTTNSDQKN